MDGLWGWGVERSKIKMDFLAWKSARLSILKGKLYSKWTCTKRCMDGAGQVHESTLCTKELIAILNCSIASECSRRCIQTYKISEYIDYPYQIEWQFIWFDYFVDILWLDVEPKPNAARLISKNNKFSFFFLLFSGWKTIATKTFIENIHQR